VKNLIQEAEPPQQEWSYEARRVKIHGPEAFDAMRRAGRLAAETLDFITPHVQPGIATGDLDRLCHDFIVGHGAIPAPLNYRGFPKSICTSINHVVCHGIPGDKRLQDGDIVNIDITVIVDGWHGDTSRMYYVGKPSVKASRLVDATYRAMMAGIEVVRPGARLGDIGEAIQKLAEGERFHSMFLRSAPMSLLVTAAAAPVADQWIVEDHQPLPGVGFLLACPLQQAPGRAPAVRGRSISRSIFRHQLALDAWHPHCQERGSDGRRFRSRPPLAWIIIRGWPHAYTPKR